MSSRSFEFVKRCNTLFNATLIFLCSGEYPEDIDLRYGNKMVEVGDVFSTFAMENSPSKYLIVFKSPEVALCHKLVLTNMKQFQCDEGVGDKYKIEFQKSHAQCMNFHMHMADELTASCGGKDIPCNTFAALFYANTEEMIEEVSESAGVALEHANILIMVLVTVICLWIFRRWSR